MNPQLNNSNGSLPFSVRVLMAVPQYPYPIVGGLERQAHELAKALVQGGHTVHTVSSRFDSGQNNTELIDGVHVRRVKWIDFRPARFIIYPFSLARIIFKLKHDVDLVHVHNVSWFGAFVTLFAKTIGLPVITKLPGIGDSGIPGMRHRLLGFLRIMLFKLSDAVIAITPDSIRELADIGYPQSMVLTVTNGIPLLPETKTTIPSLLSNEVTIVFVGRLMHQKGLTDLLHAWSSIKARATRPVMLHLIGDGPQAGELRALAMALELGDSVKFLGHCNDVQGELAKADVFVLPSYAEGNSNAILEAMRAGLPVVATRVGGIPIQVGSEGERFLVKPGNRQALATKILELIEDEALRHRFGAAMRTRIEKVFTIDRIASIYEQAYHLILSGRREQIGQINPDLFGRSQTEDPQCAV